MSWWDSKSIVQGALLPAAVSFKALQETLSHNCIEMFSHFFRRLSESSYGDGLQITAILIMNAETPPTLCNQSESVCADEHNSSATRLFTTGDST